MQIVSPSHCAKPLHRDAHGKTQKSPSRSTHVTLSGFMRAVTAERSVGHGRSLLAARITNMRVRVRRPGMGSPAQSRAEQFPFVWIAIVALRSAQVRHLAASRPTEATARARPGDVALVGVELHRCDLAERLRPRAARPTRRRTDQSRLSRSRVSCTIAVVSTPGTLQEMSADDQA
jgi:hypothetical protein